MVPERKNIQDTENEQYYPEWIKKLRELVQIQLIKDKNKDFQNNIMIILLKAYNENGKIDEDSLNLTQKLHERGLNNIEVTKTVIADNPSKFIFDDKQGLHGQYNATSGCHFFNPQPVVRQNVQNEKVIINSKPVIFPKLRYDSNDPIDKRWNLEIIIADEEDISDIKRTIAIIHPKKSLHHMPDCSWIEIIWSIDGNNFYKIKNYKPII